MSFQNHFLVALPALADDYFEHSLSLIVDHNDNGAFGLMINRPLEQNLTAIFPDLDASITCPLYEGGPVEQDKLFFLHNAADSFESTFKVSPELGLTTSRDIIDQLHEGRSPKSLMAILGYAGWGPQQLEKELGENTWLITPVDLQIVFHEEPEHRAAAAASQFGVDLNLIGLEAGHD